MKVVCLAGGTGGAKLARGLLDHVGAGLTVVANTGDDVEIHGGHVSPDPDLCCFWLADRIDDRGWGLAGDTFAVMDTLAALGEDVWFRLGDRDLAICLQRARRLAAGARPTECQLELCASFGLAARVLPMTDAPVRTRVRTGGEWHGLQEFLIRHRGAPVEEFALDGAAAAPPSPEVLAAVADADAIVIGPSNPAISIGPILALAGMREALAAARAPVVAVSPIVGGHVLKGPTADFLASMGLEASAEGIARAYAGVATALVADEPCTSLPCHVTATRMDDGRSRAALAETVLTVARGLAG